MTPPAPRSTYLRSYGPCPVGTLLRVFGHKPSTLTSMLERLVRAGLVTRESSPEDRRVVLIGMTARGRSVADRLRKELTILEREIRSRLSEREVAGFRAVMAAIEEVTMNHKAGKEPGTP